MHPLLTIWSRLSIAKKTVVLAASVGVFFAVLAMARIVAAPSLTLLYSGLDPAAAGQVVQSLDARGVIHEVRGSAIYVDARQRDSLRMGLATEGLPATGSGGYELLDELSGFGTTSQMFDAAYWRAKEGEIARTIAASPNISSARVHIAQGGNNPFRQGQTPTASVALGTSGTSLTQAQATALKFLVSSAVAGLNPDDVAIIGPNGALVSDQDAGSVADQGENRSAQIKRKVERLLEARVGLGNAIVEVSVETVMDREAIRERTFDPQGRVAISTDTEEVTNTATQQSPGQVSVASNLPDGDGNSSGSSNSQNNQTRERINFEVSEVEREVVREPGAIKRLSIAVLVNGIEQTGENGAVEMVPRDEAELEALRELVASSAGYDEDRGDTITIKSMNLLAIAPQGTEVQTSFLDNFSFDPMAIIQTTVLAIVVMVLGLFVIRPLILSKALSAPVGENSSAATGATPPEQTLELDSDALPAPPMDGGISIPQIELGSAYDDEPGALPQLPMLGGFDAESQGQDAAARLKTIIGERQTETVEILRNWLEEKEGA